MRHAASLVWFRALALLALPGCLVSFNDYPLGDPKLGASGDADRGGAAGTGSVLPKGGSASTGGSTAAGSSGEAGAPDVTAPGDASLLIDDFEDGDADILRQRGRTGSWYVANDRGGMQTPADGMPLVPSLLVPARGASAYGAHTFGGPFPTWGALIGAPFVANGPSGNPYDLSAYQGVRLWIRSAATGTAAAKQVRFSLRTPATVPGGGCSVCNDHFSVVIPLTAKWEQIELPFASLKQAGYGRPLLASPDLAHALGVELIFAANVSFDVWLDDVELY